MARKTGRSSRSMRSGRSGSKNNNPSGKNQYTSGRGSSSSKSER